MFLDEAASHIALTREALDAAIRRAMDLIGVDDAGAWITHRGYGLRLK